MGVRTTAVLAALFALLAGTPDAALADATASRTVSANEVTAALARLNAKNSGLIAEAVAHKADADSAAATASVDVPANAERGVTLTTGTQRLTLSLPNAQHAGKAKRSADGRIAYGSNNATADAVIPTANGAQMLSYIKNRKAPQHYYYCASHGVFKMLPGGGAMLVQNSQPVYFVAPPTANEVHSGKPVATHYIAKRNCLVQYVAHKASGVQYPIVADPYFERYWWGTYTHLTRHETYRLSHGASLMAIFAIDPRLVIPLGYLGWWAQGVYDRGKCAVVFSNLAYAWIYEENCWGGGGW